MGVALGIVGILVTVVVAILIYRRSTSDVRSQVDGLRRENADLRGEVARLRQTLDDTPGRIVHLLVESGFVPQGLAEEAQRKVVAETVFKYSVGIDQPTDVRARHSHGPGGPIGETLVQESPFSSGIFDLSAKNQNEKRRHKNQR